MNLDIISQSLLDTLHHESTLEKQAIFRKTIQALAGGAKPAEMMVQRGARVAPKTPGVAPPAPKMSPVAATDTQAHLGLGLAADRTQKGINAASAAVDDAAARGLAAVNVAGGEALGNLSKTLAAPEGATGVAAKARNLLSYGADAAADYTRKGSYLLQRPESIQQIQGALGAGKPGLVSSAIMALGGDAAPLGEALTRAILPTAVERGTQVATMAAKAAPKAAKKAVYHARELTPRGKVKNALNAANESGGLMSPDALSGLLTRLQG